VQVELSGMRILFELLGFLLRLGGSRQGCCAGQGE